MIGAFLCAMAGSTAIGMWTNELQDWYVKKHEDTSLYTFLPWEYPEKAYIWENGQLVEAPFTITGEQVIFYIISYGQAILIPLWCMASMLAGGTLFYKREMKRSIDLLGAAARKISANELDFELPPQKPNELGMLCNAFEEMRDSLEKNNIEMWHMLEDRKRLNAAFSHDLRTPLTVLKGYCDVLSKYDEAKISEEKRGEILSKMSQQVERLESYTHKMSEAQKIGDIEPSVTSVQTVELMEALKECGQMLCGEKALSFHCHFSQDTLQMDRELFMEAYENLLTNAARYASQKVTVNLTQQEDQLVLTVTDDGKGLSAQALTMAAEPFYRGEKEQNGMHFGLGLYICRIICAKCGGKLVVENAGQNEAPVPEAEGAEPAMTGAKISATFSVK